MKLSLEIGAAEAAALSVISKKEHRPMIQYLRDAIYFLLRDRAARDPEVREILDRCEVPRTEGANR